MKRSTWITLIAATLVLVIAINTSAQDLVRIATDLGPNTLDQVFGAGDLAPVTFYVSGDGQAGVFGVDFDIRSVSDDVRIASVTYDPAFPAALRGRDQTFPTLRVHTVRTQRLRRVDRALGARGQPVPFATVELEVLNDANFESALQVEARGTLVGQAPSGTNVLGTVSDEGRAARTAIPVINARPVPVPPAPDPWIVDFAAATMEVRPIGGRLPVSTLAPNTTYELHYDATQGGITGYILFAVGTSEGAPLATAAPPDSGAWSDTGWFTFEPLGARLNAAAPAYGYPDGLYRYALLGDDLVPGVDTLGRATGHLCNFTTGEAGLLGLALILYAEDFDTYDIVEMATFAQLPVTAPLNDEAP